MSIFDNPHFDAHETVNFVHDAPTGLRAIIAIHDTRLGPAAGGCRFWDYESEDAAIADVLRLSHGMTCKNAVAGLDLGGGKSVIIGDPRAIKTPALMRAFGRAVERLGGAYTTAEDVGVDVQDMEHVRETTRHVAGLARGAHASGDPSPTTAKGIFDGMSRAVAQRFKRDGITGMRVAVQGLGHVGWHLCTHLHGAGARLIVSDIDAARVERAVMEFGATACPPKDILTVEADVFAPCALGAVLNARSIPALRVAIVAGAANNQLEDFADADRLHARGILYVPDFAINAGGIISVSGEIAGVDNVEWIAERMRQLDENIAEILAEAEAERVSPHHIAMRFAERRLDAAGR
ncbi:Glu/Leu/Phe/Val family dehydrogenase [Saliniramus sp.]|uniref:Glu/Leu/Phe/Val family dehydrogenase n=1 Tax=Saliniramus sp. TaxID=2986772 RepID=UPI002B5B35AD|nr:Glu/Leu/Phe/Val dehydrogenase dimerization domain-containing protein [Saliniramus sp.]HMB11494.1 Glu/Leu/Phe/Val dehydrogenase dimerization domain-containing protein [Saliniramus sp.]